MAARAYEHLRHLLEAYFHQDWDLEAADWRGVVQLYKKDVAPEDADAAADEIEQLLADGKQDRLLIGRLLREFGCYYDPRPDTHGPTLEEWLNQVALALRQKQSQE